MVPIETTIPETTMPLFIAIPLAVAFLLPVVARRRRWIADLLCNATQLALLALAVAGFGSQALYHMGGWPTPVGIDLRLDPLVSLMLVTINGIAFACALYSVEYMRRYTDKHRYYALFLFLVAGMNGVVLAGDLFNLYVFMEIAAVASYALVAFGCEREELEASFKYAVQGTLASSLILIGIGLLYGVTGTLNMAHLAIRLAETGMSPPLLFASALLLCGFSLKAALTPFHAWLPDAHPAAPAPVSAMLSGVLIKSIGIYVVARLLYNVFGVAHTELSVLRWLGVISMVIGGLLAAGQWDLKRLFAYSSVSQVGYIALGLGLGTPLGVVGGLYHLINHSVFKSLLFLNAGAVEYATGTRDLKRLGGLNRSMPVTGVTSLVASMSISGVPPFNGFWSKLIIVVACVEAGFYGFATVAVIMSIVTLAYQLKVQRHAFFAAPSSELRPCRGEPRLMAAAMILLAVGCGALSLLVATGLGRPLFVGAAEEILLAGAFSR